MSNKKNIPLTMTRRELLSMVCKVAGSAAMYPMMSTLGFASPSSYKGAAQLQGAPSNTNILILGAGIAGLVAAYELRKAGYKVKVLEYNHRAGGRAWTIRGGDEYVELGGAKQRCEFDKGQYFNPGPWRIPYDHHGILDYAKRFNVPLEPFIQINYNAYLHSRNAYGGKPQRYRHVHADYHGYTAEMLSKAVNKHQLDQPLTADDQEKLLDSLRKWGALDKQSNYQASALTSDRRGYEVSAGGGLMPLAVPSTPLKLQELLQSGLSKYLSIGDEQEFHSTIFQPVGGMDQIAQAIYREVADLVQFNAKVTKIEQDEHGVTVTYTNAQGTTATHQAKADWCLCTIPLSILSQIEMNVGSDMQNAIQAVPYESAFKIGLQFKRRFWEQDDHIYGGITYTDLPINRISYPAHGYGQPGKGVLLGAYIFGDLNAYEFTAMSPKERLQAALEQGASIHPQYQKEFETGISVGWHRVPFSNGCSGIWTEETRQQHYKNLCQIDGRIALAGEHASYLPAWQEGAVLSSLDAIQRMHALIKSKA
ncbi:MAG: flavin monoamine oxidase family protein [Pseudomonadota bacterium]